MNDRGPAAAQPDPAAAQPYEETSDYRWTETAFTMLVEGRLRADVRPAPVVASRVWGPCPRCGHPLDDRQTHTAVTNQYGYRMRGRGQVRQDPPPAYIDVDVSCACDHPHRGAPKGTRGCGVSFRVMLPTTTGDKS
jgi:hypothetical protein